MTSMLDWSKVRIAIVEQRLRRYSQLIQDAPHFCMLQFGERLGGVFGPCFRHAFQPAIDVPLAGLLQRLDLDLCEGVGEKERADFLVLSSDPLECRPEAIKDARVLQTWVNGEPIVVRP